MIAHFFDDPCAWCPVCDRLVWVTEGALTEHSSPVSLAWLAAHPDGALPPCPFGLEPSRAKPGSGLTPREVGAMRKPPIRPRKAVRLVR